MIGKTAVVVDSASYLPAEVRERFGMIVVPLAVSIDGRDYQELVDIDAATFYERLASGASVATSQPSPGRFVSAYEQARSRGAERVVSIHIGSALSGTVNSARIAAGMVELPVDIIDTGQASFIEGLCAWEACEALEAGKSLDEAKEAALRAAALAGNVFIVRGLELLRKGGRMKAEGAAEPAGVPVLALVEGAVRPIGMARNVDEAMEAMLTHLRTAIKDHPWKSVRVGVANGAAPELAAELEERVREVPAVGEVVRYEVGPAVGAHTGPGCTGLVFLPRPV